VIEQRGVSLLERVEFVQEIGKGFIYDGVKYDLSDRDQLNYTAASSMSNMGAEEIVVVGEFNGDKYHKVSFTNEEAKQFFSEMFLHVADILSIYREYKKRIIDDIEGNEENIFAEAKDKFTERNGESDNSDSQ